MSPAPPSIPHGLAFAGSDENAVVDGDFAVPENELRKALKSLREAGINIVAIQSHVISEEPRIIFFHYWGRGSAQNLAQSIQKALLATAGTPAKPRASEVRTSASVTRYVQIL